jgi:hypothetical protein
MGSTPVRDAKFSTRHTPFTLMMIRNLPVLLPYVDTAQAEKNH